MQREKWEEILNKYVLLKKLYIECEETDPELKTNLQPLNELRAALDHICRMIQCELDIIDEDPKAAAKAAAKFVVEHEKTGSHICRAFFDICDMLSLNYRNKIIDFLKPYSYDVIRTALPEYYPKFKLEIEKISTSIIDYRTMKGKRDENELFQSYYQNIIKLRDIYTKITDTLPSLHELKIKEKKKKLMPWVGLIIGILGLISAIWGQLRRF